MVDLAVPEFELLAVRLRLSEGLAARLKSEDEANREEAAVRVLELAHIAQPNINMKTRIGQLLRYVRQEDRALFDRISRPGVSPLREVITVGREYP